MASGGVIVIDDGELQCSICFEQYKRPRILPCLHSFCDLCLRRYITRASLISGFKCPVCRKVIRPPKQCDSVDKLVDSIKEDFKLVSILDSSKNQRERIKTVDNKTVIKKLCKCPLHPSHRVEYVCINHNQFCCSKCNFESHRACDQIVPLQNKASSYASAETAIVGDIKELQNHTEFLLAKETKQMNHLGSMRDRAELKLQEMRAKVKAYLKDVSEKTLNLVESKYGEMSADTEKNKNALEVLKYKIIEVKGNLAKVLKYGDEGDKCFYIAQQQLLLKEYSEELKTLQDSMKCHDAEVNFDSDLTCLKSIVGLQVQQGKPKLPTPPNPLSLLNQQRPHQPTLVPPPLQVLPASLQQQQQIKIVKLRSKIATPFAGIKGCIWLTQDFIAICDDISSQITAVNISSGVISTKSFHCPSSPLSMTKVGNNQIAVSFSNNTSILIIDILQLAWSEIKTQRYPNALAYNGVDGYLLVLSTDGSITCLTQNGTELGSIPLPRDVKQVVEHTSFMAFNPRNRVCYLSGSQKFCVVAIDLQGRVLGLYEHDNLKSPRTITIGQDGHVYVCSALGHAIQQLNGDGQFVRELLTSRDGLRHPTSLCFNENMDQFVCNSDKELMLYDYVS